MSDSNKKKSTSGILKNLLNAKDFEVFTEANADSFIEENFGEYLCRICEAKGISRSDIVKLSGIDRTYAYQMLSGVRNPTRDKVLQFAIGLGFTVDETQALLKNSRMSTLYPRIKRDAAIIFCIEHQMSIIETQSMLDKIGEKTLS